ncbi:MAG: VWA domain-containing protein [Pyrinomonadaceae bacterium]|nr:VWA domain-containing protein [Pyrinomonadaceae bacterium]
MVLVLATTASAQSPKPAPSPTPPAQQEEPVKVFTEEVRLQVIAKDQFGHYDPSVVPDDILVLEDGVAQQIKSVRHIPANVLLVLDTGGELSGLGGHSKRTGLTREVAVALIRHLSEGPSIAVMQFSSTPELVQPWTTDRKAILRVLETKLSAGKRARFSDAVAAAAKLLLERPEGSRHVVFVTDGVDTPGGKIGRTQAIRQLAAARATVHIISYTEFVRQPRGKNSKSPITIGQLPTSSDPMRTTDPTQPPGQNRSPAFGVAIRFDPAMKRQRKVYEAEIKKSQLLLTEMAEETGGQIRLPKTSDEMVVQAKEVARDVGAEYVVTYRPKRPLASAAQGEYRRVQVASRRVGLSLRSRRGYVVPSQP